jgi:hypothetical protein
MYALSGGLQVEPAPVLGEIQSSDRTCARVRQKTRGTGKKCAYEKSMKRSKKSDERLQ